MTPKRQSELQRLVFIFLLILLLTNPEIASYVRKMVFAQLSWKHIILIILGLRIAYILLQELLGGKKR